VKPDHRRLFRPSLFATIWSHINTDQDIAVEQVVGGNGGKGSFQFSCRKYLAEKTD
jgi:hypothetical protein